jgi:heptosyltransferase-2
MQTPRNIVVFLPNWVGDVVMATPVLRAVRHHFDQARIVHFGRAVALETVAGCEWACETIADVSSHRPRGSRMLATVAQLRTGRFDLAVLLPNSFRVALLARLAGIRRIAGYDRDGRGWMLTDKLAPPRDPDGTFTAVPAVDYYIALAGELGVRCESRRIELPVAEVDEAEADAMLAEAGANADRPIVTINPGGAFGPSKLWAPERFAAVADALIERYDAEIILNAAPSEQHIAAEVARAMRHAPLLNFAERRNRIGLLRSLIRRSTLLVTNDTGPRHFAAAMGVGVVTIFGSTDPRWAQIDYELERAVRVDVPCGPCQQKICSEPPGPTHHQCMEAIGPEMVLAPAEQLLRIATTKGVNR